MDIQPVVTKYSTDFAGNEYGVEELPNSADCAEGDTCTICWPGGSGWYQTWYKIVDGQWVEEGNNAPWQLSA